MSPNALICSFILIILHVIFVAVAQENGTSTATTTAPPTTQTTQFPQQGIGPCVCDLTPQSCDIGCCCDSDCTADDIQSFVASCKAFSFENIQTCLPTYVFFRYKQPYKVNTSAADQVCFYKDDFKSRNSYTEPVLAADITEAKKIYNSYKVYAFPTSASTRTDFTNLADLYKEKSNIFIYYPTNTIGLFSLPTVQSSSACGSEMPIEFLADRSVTCQQSLNPSVERICGTSAFLNVSNYISNFKVVSSPSVFSSNLNETRNDTVVVETPQPYESPGLLSINATNVTCADGSVCNTTSLSPEYNSTSKECSNVLISLQYNFEYDGSSGITAVTATVVLGTLKSSSTSFSQTIAVNFRSKNETSSAVRSGNPGYLVGKPVLAGKVVNVTNNKQAIEVSSDPSTQLTVVSGLQCSDSAARTGVAFGVSMSSGCKIKVTKDVDSSCISLQNTIISALQGKNFPERIASFGNSLTTNPDDWVPIYSTGLGSVPTSFPSGCSQIVVGAQLSILFGNAGSVTNPQSRIIGAEMKYIKGDIKYSCLGGACLNDSTVEQEYPITMDVQFVDASVSGGNQAATDLVSQSHFENDFLYVFYVEAQSSTLVPLFRSYYYVFTVITLLFVNCFR